jgi:hypothetical protein
MRRFVWLVPLAVAGITILGCGTSSTPQSQAPSQAPSEAKVTVASANEVVLNVPGMT